MLGKIEAIQCVGGSFSTGKTIGMWSDKDDSEVTCKVKEIVYCVEKKQYLVVIRGVVNKTIGVNENRVELVIYEEEADENN